MSHHLRSRRRTAFACAFCLWFLASCMLSAEEPMPENSPFENVRGWQGLTPGMSPDETRAALKAAGIGFRERFHGKDGSLWFTLELANEEEGTVYFETESQKVNQILLQSPSLKSKEEAAARVEARRKAWGEPHETRSTVYRDNGREDTFHIWRNARVTAELTVAHYPAPEEHWIVWEKYVPPAPPEEGGGGGK